MLVPLAYMSAISALSAQNIGAQKSERARQALKYGIATLLPIGIVLFFTVFFRGSAFAALFTNNMEVIAACAEYMKSYAIDCIMVSILFCFMGYFNGCGKTAFVMAQGIPAAFLVSIPYCYFMSKSVNVTMFSMGFASPIATAFSITICIFYFGYIVRKSKLRSCNCIMEKHLSNKSHI